MWCSRKTKSCNGTATVPKLAQFPFPERKFAGVTWLLHIVAAAFGYDGGRLIVRSRTGRILCRAPNTLVSFALWK